MGYEVDFMAVGEGKSGGDAIAIRHGNLSGLRDEQYITVIDGGTTDTGNKLVTHIKEIYSSENVDLVISTHPDADHSAGLAVVLENLDVSQLWIHQPWKHSKSIENLITDGRVTNKSIEERFRKSLESAYEIEQIANRKKIAIVEPFAGLTNENGIIVLGPSEKFYESLLPSFRAIGETPEQGFIRGIVGIAAELVKTVAESLEIETLDDNGETSSENNSSVILFFELDDEHMLFTADSGILALDNAADFALSNSIDIRTTNFIQVPHHGSKRNVGPTILDRILSPKNNSDNKSRVAYVSAPKDGFPKHPAKKVINAFIRRNATVYATMGNNLCHSYQSPKRENWSTANPLEFYNSVDE